LFVKKTQALTRRLRFLLALTFSYIQISRCRIVDELSISSEAGAVARTIPCLLSWVPFERAAKMGTARSCGSKQFDNSFDGVFGKLRPQNCARWIENIFVWTALSA